MFAAAVTSQSNDTFTIDPKDNNTQPLLLFSRKLHTAKIRMDCPGLERECSEAAVLTPTLTECCAYVERAPL